MVSLFKLLSKKYDKDIRKSCEKNNKRLENCLLDNKFDEDICKNLLDDFNKCIKSFDNNFKKKYNLFFKKRFDKSSYFF